MGNSLLKISNLNVGYPVKEGLVRAVDEMNLEIAEGEIFGIAGESGCGKSTLVNAILGGLSYPGYVEGGSIAFKDVELVNLRGENLRQIRGKRISLIPQNSMNVLNPVLKIHDQLIDMFREHRVHKSRRERRKLVSELLTAVGLTDDIAQMYPHELSGGMRQRATIAISVILNPELLIADEPTTALDVSTQRAVLQLLSDFRENLKMTIILVTHDMGVHAQIADRFCVMYAGRICEIGNVEAVFKKPLHPYSHALILSIPLIGEERALLGLPGSPPQLSNPPSGCRFHPRCKYAQEICTLKTPSLREVRRGQMVACHFSESIADELLIRS